MIQIFERLFLSPEQRALRLVAKNKKKINKLGGASHFIKTHVSKVNENKWQAAAGILFADENYLNPSLVQLAALAHLYEMLYLNTVKFVKGAAGDGINNIDVITLKESVFDKNSEQYKTARVAFAESMGLIDFVKEKDLANDAGFKLLGHESVRYAVEQARLATLDLVLENMLNISKSTNYDPSNIRNLLLSSSSPTLRFFIEKQIANVKKAEGDFDNWLEDTNALKRFVVGVKT